MKTISIKNEFINEMIAHSREDKPSEACGVLSGSKNEVSRVIRMKNVDESSITYLMDAREQFKTIKEIRDNGEELIGIYHSHVASRAYPSSTDVKLAFYPEAAYVIISLENKENPDVKAYNIVDGEITDVEIIE